MTAPPRVLLVEDDASIRRFVRDALDGIAIELVQAPTLAAARAALSAGPLRLLLCDLLLPDGDGAAWLAERAAARAGAAWPRLVAFSAGVDGARRERLLAGGVDEVLAKPVALRDLEACVRRALATPADPAPQAGSPFAAPDAGTPFAASHAGGAAGCGDAAEGDDPVARFFGGDAALHAAFLAHCRPQFARDAAAGDAAAAAGDLAALRRLGHSLSSVLLTLGLDADSRRAKALESAAARGDAPTVAATWARLRAALQALSDGR